MTWLPNRDAASIDDAKLRDDVLDPCHPGNGGKARFFAAVGFDRASWTILRDALRTHPMRHPLLRVSSGPHGDKFIVQCALHTPDGRNPCIRSVWVIDPGGRAPRFVTAYPAAPPTPP